jgi:hypothetical protein
MRMLELPKNPESLRPILETLKTFLAHHEALVLEAGDLADMEARYGDQDWYQERARAFEQKVRSPGPGYNVFFSYIDFPFRWDPTSRKPEKGFEFALAAWTMQENIVKAGFLRGILSLAQKLNFEIIDALNAPVSKALSQDRLRVTLAAGESFVTLDGVNYATILGSALFLDALIQADGKRVAFKEFQASHPELEGATGTRVLRQLNSKILGFVEHTQGRAPRLKVELLKRE